MVVTYHHAITLGLFVSMVLHIQTTNARNAMHLLGRLGIERKQMKTILSVIGIIAFLAAIGWMEISLWTECRETNSWLYCMRIISR